jgi:hypothetical protein
MHHESMLKAQAEHKLYENSLRDEFQRLLKDFTQTLDAKAKDYKKTRMLLNEMIRPANFEDQIIAKETYEFLNNQLAPDLNKKAEAVIAVFETYRTLIEDQFKNDTLELKEEIKRDWDAVEKDNLEPYVDFFINETRRLKSYKDLVAFYYMHVNLISFNEQSGAIEFQNPAYAAEHEKLLRTIDDTNTSQ